MRKILNFRKPLLVLAVFGVISGSALTARADVVYLGPIEIQGSGLGAVSTILTIQATPFEQGSVGRAGGADVTSGDTTALNSTRTLSELGVTTGDTLRIVFNIDETGSPGATSREVTLQQLVVTIWNGNTQVGTFTCSACAAGGLTLGQAGGGIGGTGHVFGLDAAQAAQLQALITTHGLGLRVGLIAAVGCPGGESGATCRGTDNGPETFHGTNGPGAGAVPEPASMLLLGTGLIGVAAGLRRRRKNK